MPPKIPKKTLFANVQAKSKFLTKKKKEIEKRADRAKKRAKYDQQLEEVETVPRSLVFHRGRISKSLKNLESNFKKAVMMPYTAPSAIVSKRLAMKDLKQIATKMYTTHMLVFSSNEWGTWLRVIRLPHGPTLTFSVSKYCTMADVFHFIKFTNQSAFPMTKSLFNSSPPMAILNGFNTPNKVHLRLVAATLHSLFPPIDINNLDLKNLNKRAILFCYDPKTDNIEVRHYGIGFGKDASDEGKRKMRVRLVDIGPRLTIKLDKIEEGYLTGEVLYHSRVSKSEEEIQELRKVHESKAALKEKRKKEQEERVQEKTSQKTDNKQSKKKQKESKREQAQRKLEQMISKSNKRPSSSKEQSKDEGHKNKKQRTK